MDKELRNLKRLSNTDPNIKDRYICALERIAGLADPSEEGKLKCLVTHCPNHANEGHGMYLLTQHNTPGEAPYTWDNALGPLFICGPCYTHLKNAPWRPAPASSAPQNTSQYVTQNLHSYVNGYITFGNTNSFAQGYNIEQDQP